MRSVAALPVGQKLAIALDIADRAHVSGQGAIVFDGARVKP